MKLPNFDSAFEYLSAHSVHDFAQALEESKDNCIQFMRAASTYPANARYVQFSAFPSEAMQSIRPVWDMLIAHRSVHESLKIFSGTAVSDECFISRDRRVFFDPECFPGYLSQLINNSPMFLHRMRTVANARREHIGGPVIVLHHPHTRIYGHFLVESLPKHCIIRYLYDRGLHIPVYVHENISNYALDALKLFIPDVRLFVAKRNTLYQFSHVIVPSVDLLNVYNEYRIKCLDLISTYCAAMWNSRGIANSSDDYLFISRNYPRGSSFRHLANEHELEDVATRAGFLLIAPERIPFPEQIARFRLARAVVGEYSSALHNMLFGQERASTICFNWINIVQLAISVARKQDLTVIKPENADFIKAHDGGRREYAISPTMLQKALDNLR